MSRMDRTRTTRQDLFLQRLEEAKDRLLKSISGFDSEAVCTGRVVGDWTVKDIFGHIVSWNEEFRADIRLIQQGQHPGYARLISGDDDFAQWNQGWILQKRNWTWQQIQEDFNLDYLEAVQLIQSLEPADYRKRGVTPWKRAAVDRPPVLTVSDTETIETLMTYHWRHMNQHAHQIEKWRKQLESTRKVMHV